MADDGFNGSKIKIGEADQVPLRDIEYSSEAAKVDISGAADTYKTYVAGIPDNTITFTVVGRTTVEIGDTETFTITWNDGTTDVLTDGIVVGVSATGSLDGEITSSITVATTTAPA
jgi:hypothetical protein